MSKYRCLISCPDAIGIIYKVAKVLADNKLNIDENGEFVDAETHTFFMRSDLSGDVNCNDLKKELLAVLPRGAKCDLKKISPKNILIFATKESHCIGDLLIRHSANDLDANILAVVSNRQDLGDLVGKFNLPFHYVPVTSSNDSLQDRVAHEQAISNIIEDYMPDLIILAKYMRVLSKGFVGNYGSKCLNIHHSFLPAFIGANPYKQAYERGVKVIGATAHFVTDELDHGPIVAQSVLPIDHRMSWKEMRDVGKYVEKLALAQAMKLVLEDRVFLNGLRTVIL